MDDLFQDSEGVFISLLSNFVGLDINFSGLVDSIFSGLEVLELLDEVSNLSVQTVDLTVEGINGVVNNS